MTTSKEVLRLVESQENVTDLGPDSTLPVLFNLSDRNSPADVMDVLSLRPFASGEQPWSRSKRLEHVKADAPLRPGDARLVRVAHEKTKESVLAWLDGTDATPGEIGTDGATLAELAALRRGEDRAEATNAPTTATGFYL